MGDGELDRWKELALRAGLTPPSRKAILTAAAVGALLCGWCAWRWWPAGPVLPFDEGVSPPDAALAGSSEASATAEVFVHVAGAVAKPGLYRLAAGSRVGDAIAAAGGLLADAEPSSVNLARVVSDGEQVLVAGASDTGGSTAPGPAGAGGAAGGLVDINSADEALLDTLPGVGPATAKRIIDDREANGPFRTLEDLQRVSGIGPKKLELLRDSATVR